MEYPGLGQFVPRTKNPEKARLTQDTLDKVEQGNEVMFIPDQKFLESNNV